MTAPAYPNLHRIAYGEGARLTAEAWKADALASLVDWHELEQVVPDAFLGPHQLGRIWPHIVRDYVASLTPAHDKEKS